MGDRGSSSYGMFIYTIWPCEIRISIIDFCLSPSRIACQLDISHVITEIYLLTTILTFESWIQTEPRISHGVCRHGNLSVYQSHTDLPYSVIILSFATFSFAHTYLHPVYLCISGKSSRPVLSRRRLPESSWTQSHLTPHGPAVQELFE